MRVAIVSTPFVSVPPRAYGGTELIVHELQRGLRRAGHTVTLFATGDSTGEDVRFLFGAPIWPPDPYTEMLHCRFAMREIAREPFDVVHAHCPAALTLADDVSTPIVYTIHHEASEQMSRLYRQRPRVRFVAISARQRDLQNLPACDVVHHGLEPDLYPLGRGGGGYAFFIGRLSWCKGPDLAIEAAQRAGLDIVVAGEHHEEDDAPAGWRDRVLEPLLGRPGVRWIGSADHSAKRRNFGSAVALLAPIRWEEPFGLAMIEAMLSGCPVIAFPRGAAPELVEEDVTGFLVDDVAGMAAALRGLDRFDRAACRRRACERFSSERMVRDYLAVYREAMGGGARPRASVASGVEWTLAP